MLKSSSATTKLQKYVALPNPSGCSSVGGFADCLSPMKSRIWLVASATEWMASASMLPELV